jgi:hypothetical protein
MATSFSGGRSRSTWREPPTMGMQLVNFIPCNCNLQSRARTHTVLVISLHELLGNQHLIRDNFYFSNISDIAKLVFFNLYLNYLAFQFFVLSVLNESYFVLCVFYLYSFYVLCIPLSAFLDCQFLIAPSVFSSVYTQRSVVCLYTIYTQITVYLRSSIWMRVRIKKKTIDIKICAHNEFLEQSKPRDLNIFWCKKTKGPKHYSHTRLSSYMPWKDPS